ncbi:MAG TPA: HAD family hydrolase [Terriglobales bacterium]|nr:HAD family hydrolase [Terriglobales bacterium]
MRKAVFWDFDGTAVLSERVWGKAMILALHDVMEDAGVTAEDIYEKRPKNGYPWDKPRVDYLHLLGPGLWWNSLTAHFEQTYLACGVKPDAARMAAVRVREHMLDPKMYHEYPGVRDALTAAAALGYQNYILSNNYPELPKVMEAMGLANYFDGIFTSGAIGYEKPRPEIFHYALKAAGDPGLAVMVGDNPVADIEGGKAAGMTAVLIHCKKPSKADFTLDGFEGLIEILKSL